MAKEEIAAPQDNVKPLNYREQFQVGSMLISPCEAASKASLSCLSRNDYDRDACQAYFQAYRDCKAAWLQQRRDDRKAGRPSS
ncbi:uncharacterized protein BT62DRAFT_899827 [Guyanagaster necrorhizus]|uniref:CHCH domain-containing protein n=1 Tax=Guyanagaster necrorhizus TaxID=856835 RepID=A0A9P7VPG7_9AGAR|nr:uncharacterized protein BT62DRAFT_899827 [Guyanagaster necrorhizus MCA 3950]KAG7444293.1 hypothetical protein BT62DRAFT_899827 [Guyanagaster necrorhizus MCA 3950]